MCTGPPSHNWNLFFHDWNISFPQLKRVPLQLAYFLSDVFLSYMSTAILGSLSPVAELHVHIYLEFCVSGPCLWHWRGRQWRGRVSFKTWSREKKLWGTGQRKDSMDAMHSMHLEGKALHSYWASKARQKNKCQCMTRAGQWREEVCLHRASLEQMMIEDLDDWSPRSWSWWWLKI